MIFFNEAVGLEPLRRLLGTSPTKQLSIIQSVNIKRISMSAQPLLNMASLLETPSAKVTCVGKLVPIRSNPASAARLVARQEPEQQSRRGGPRSSNQLLLLIRRDGL